MKEEEEKKRAENEKRDYTVEKVKKSVGTK